MSGRGLKLSFYLLTPLLLVAFLFFQNCNGGFDSKEIGVKSALRLNTGLSPSTIRIWQLNRVIATNLPIVLYVNPLIFPEEEDDSSVMENEVTALYTWFYEFDGLNSGCDQKRYENLASAVELSCSRPGNLSVELYIVKSTGEVIELKTNVIVLDDSLLEPKEIEPLLNSIDYLVVDIHGTPGGLADSSGSESNQNNNMLSFYFENCSVCHGGIEISNVRRTSLSQFNRAIDLKPQMQRFQSLSTEERQALVDLLNQ